jgi:hypothetical protein
MQGRQARPISSAGAPDIPASIGGPSVITLRRAAGAVGRDAHGPAGADPLQRVAEGGGAALGLRRVGLLGGRAADGREAQPVERLGDELAVGAEGDQRARLLRLVQRPHGRAEQEAAVPEADHHALAAGPDELRPCSRPSQRQRIVRTQKRT